MRSCAVQRKSREVRSAVIHRSRPFTTGLFLATGAYRRDVILQRKQGLRSYWRDNLCVGARQFMRAATPGNGGMARQFMREQVS